MIINMKHDYQNGTVYEVQYHRQFSTLHAQHSFSHSLRVAREE